MAKATPKVIAVSGLGLKGVNVDRNPLELEDNELVRAANAISESSGGQSSVRKRPGWIAFTTDHTAGIVLGGVDLPFADRRTGARYLYIGRGPV